MTQHFSLSPAARAMVIDLGASPEEVLRVAGLGTHLFDRERVVLPPAQYYRLFRALEQVVGDPALPVALADVMSPEAFDAPIFAALCTADLATAASRIATHKQLMGPLRLTVDDDDTGLRVTVHWPDGEAPPWVVVGTELAFWVRLGRLGTRTTMTALGATAPGPPHDQARYEEYLGTTITPSPATSITFSPVDAHRPFLTANDALALALESGFAAQLPVGASGATPVTERARALLTELLPTGSSQMVDVARRLGISTRTLQRRLHREGTTFQRVLDETRASVARHYLERTALPVAEIAFLLGYDDANSFYRAFHAWTGETPARVRQPA